MARNVTQDNEWLKMLPPPLNTRKGKVKVYVSFQPHGRLVLSVEAFQLIGMAEAAELLYNPAERQVMIAPVNGERPSPDAFSVKSTTKQDGYTYGVIYCRELIAMTMPPNSPRAIKVPARLDGDNLIVDLPAEWGNAPNGRPRR